MLAVYRVLAFVLVFFSNDTAPTEIYTLSLHDALPISAGDADQAFFHELAQHLAALDTADRFHVGPRDRDRKSTRLNSSHSSISYAVFCLKKKKREIE